MLSAIIKPKVLYHISILNSTPSFKNVHHKTLRSINRLSLRYPECVDEGMTFNIAFWNGGQIIVCYRVVSNTISNLNT